MSSYFKDSEITDKSLICFGYKDIKSVRISASHARSGLFLKSKDKNIKKLQLDLDTFFELYEEFNLAYSFFKGLIEEQYDTKISKPYKSSRTEALFESSIRIENDEIIFDDLLHTDYSRYIYEYEIIEKNPKGLDRFCEEKIVSSKELESDEKYNLRLINIITMFHCQPIENNVLGKFVNLAQMKLLYKEACKISKNL